MKERKILDIKSSWIAFSDMQPKEESALDSPQLRAMPKLIVTNNITALNRMGRQSHVWFEMPIYDKNSNTWCAFTDGNIQIQNLTHWFDPFNI